MTLYYTLVCDPSSIRSFIFRDDVFILYLVSFHPTNHRRKLNVVVVVMGAAMT